MASTVLEVQPGDVCGTVVAGGKRYWLFNARTNNETMEVSIEDDGDIWLNSPDVEATLFDAQARRSINFNPRTWKRFEGVTSNEIEHDGVIVETPVALVAGGAFIGDNIGTENAEIILDRIPDEERPPSELRAGLAPGGFLPDNLCQGVEPEIELQISNPGICEPILADLELTNHITGEVIFRSFSINPDDAVRSTFTIEVPAGASTGLSDFFTADITSDAIVEPDTTISQDGEILEQADMQFDRIERPDSVCVGSAFNIRAIIRNIGDCASEIRATFESPDTGQFETIGPITVAGGEEGSLSFSDTVPEEFLDIGTADISIEAEQKIGGDWELIGTRTTDVGISEPSVDILEQ